MTALSLTPLDGHVAQWVRNIGVSPLQRALAVASDPTVLSLSLGLPDPDLFPTAAFAECCARVLATNPTALQYTLPAEKLKAQICRHMATRGVQCFPENVFLTVGAQQGLSLLARLLLDNGAMVLEEELSYTAFQQAIEPYSPHIVSIPSSAPAGIDLDALERAMARHPRPAFLYIMADGHNPLAVSISPEKRRRLAHMAREFQVPIIEDDPYGFLSFDGPAQPPIRAFESDWVYYVGSFSKLLAPSLRVGWLIIPASLARPLSVIKEGSDINMSTFSQWIVADYLESGRLPAHIEMLRAEYGARRSAMASALEAAFPCYARWYMPTCGVFFWVDFDANLDTTELLSAAIERERVAFVPSEAFSRGKRSNGMRLNFSRCRSKEITEAVTRIGRILPAAC